MNNNLLPYGDDMARANLSFRDLLEMLRDARELIPIITEIIDVFCENSTQAHERGRFVSLRSV